MEKKGVEMSIQTMVVVALAVLILVILIVVFQGSISNWGEANACSNKGDGYECRNSCGDNEMATSGSCPNDGDKCCVDRGVITSPNS